MSQPHTYDDELMADREVRDSIMIIRKQRTTRLVIVVLGLLVALGVLFASVYYAYHSELDATKGLPTQVE